MFMWVSSTKTFRQKSELVFSSYTRSGNVLPRQKKISSGSIFLGGTSNFLNDPCVFIYIHIY